MFLSRITGLTSNTTYYVRAYARNSAGTALEEVLSFTTPEFTEILFNPQLNYGLVTDIDGNEYRTIQIGTQEWLAENLKTTKYNDGTPIRNVTDDNEWHNLTSDAYSWYNNNETSFKSTYGALYNWYAVNTGKLCPSGWHVPSNDEWMILTTYLGGVQIAGEKLKETGTSHWLAPIKNATNASGFSAVPGGERKRSEGANFEGINIYGTWMSSDLTMEDISGWGDFEEVASTWFLSHQESNFVLWVSYKSDGISVRCVKDN